MTIAFYSKFTEITNPRTGVTKTLGEWAEELGVHVTTLRRRLERGVVSFDKALNTSKLRKRRLTFTDPVSGDTRTINEWARLTGVAPTTIDQRIRNRDVPREHVLYKGDLRHFARIKRMGKMLTPEERDQAPLALALLQLVREKADEGVAGFDKLIAAAERKVASRA